MPYKERRKNPYGSTEKAVESHPAFRVAISAVLSPSGKSLGLACALLRLGKALLML